MLELYKTETQIMNFNFFRKGTLSLIFLLMLVIPLVQAVSPFQTSSVGTMEIEYTKYDYVYLGEEHRFHVHVINSTSIKTNRTTSCFLHLYNDTGFDFTTLPVQMEWETYSNPQFDFALTVNGSFFSRVGQYAYVIECNSSNEVAFISAPLQVIQKPVIVYTGKTSTTSDWRVFVILILLSMSLLIFSLYSKSYTFSFITALGFVLSGIYSMVYGFDNVVDLYTRAIGLILIAIGGILAALSVFSMMKENYGGSSEEED